MKLTKEQSIKFLEVVRPVIKFMAEETHPHCTMIINSTTAELLEGQKALNTEEYLLD
jgi:hypothetical protein